MKQENQDIVSRHLWIGNIGTEVTEKDIIQEFKAFGEIESLRVLPDKHCAFVNFVNEKSAVDAKAKLFGTILGSQYIVINFRTVTDNKFIC